MCISEPTQVRTFIIHNCTTYRSPITFSIIKGERPYICLVCNRGFSQAQQLKYHAHSAHGGPPMSRRARAIVDESSDHVIQSDAPSNDGETLATTNQTHSTTTTTRVLPYICSQCNRAFKLPSSLASHMKKHTEDRKHVCKECGNTFKRAEHLRIHVNGVHLKQKSYSCHYCEKRFAQSGDRNIHMRRHTGNNIDNHNWVMSIGHCHCISQQTLSTRII